MIIHREYNFLEREREELLRRIVEHRSEIERRFEEQKEKELNTIFHREYNLQHVNHCLADFLPNGIRKFLLDHAMASGLRGRVSRDFHDHVHIVMEGKKHELAKMKAVIDDLKRRTVVGEIVPFRLDHAIEDYHYDSFEIGPNLHNRCAKNARSAGDQWEKKSSSRGSDRFVFEGGYDSQKKYC